MRAPSGRRGPVTQHVVPMTTDMNQPLAARFWSSYLFIASALALVVLFSGLLSMYMTSRAQARDYVMKLLCARMALGCACLLSMYMTPRAQARLKASIAVSVCL